MREARTAEQDAGVGRWPRGFLLTGLLLVAFWGSVAPCFAAQAGPGRGEQVWLAVSDIHLNPFDTSSRPSPYGADTNTALFKSAIARMRRAAPNAAVILVPGDLLAHAFGRAAARRGETPEHAAIRTMRSIAETFNRAFPRAQFAVALGNNDIPCGDYRSANGSAYLAAVARAWSPLVNRGGGSQDFGASFARGGYYVAKLPVRGLRLVVLNTVSLSNQYKGDCGSNDLEAAAKELAWLKSTLHATPAGMHNLVMMHIPPGFDAFSTAYLRGLTPWPFLRPRYNGALVDDLAARSDRAAYAIAGHTHRFDFRLAGRVPLIVLGSLSPIYGNDSTFYALHVSANGSLRDIDVYAFDQRLGTWLPPHSFDRTWNLEGIDARSLARLHAQLGESPAARAVWNYQAEGWPSDLIEAPGAWAGPWWRVSWCAQAFLVIGFADCAGIRGRAFVAVAVLALVIALVAICVSVVLARRVRRQRQTEIGPQP